MIHLLINGLDYEFHWIPTIDPLLLIEYSIKYFFMIHYWFIYCLLIYPLLKSIEFLLFAPPEG